MKPIVGSIVAMVTPMHDDGSIDFDGLRSLIDWHVAEGTDCICVVGTTGESPTVSVDEHCEIIRVAVEHAKGRVPIMAGTGGNSTREAIELARYAAKVGADCSLSVVPYYNKPSQEGIYQHFKAIAEAVDLPMMLYNVPGRTVADMSVETTLRLAQIPGIFGIKEASGDIGRAGLADQAGAGRFCRLFGRRLDRGGADAARRQGQCQRHRQRRAARDARAVHGGDRRPGSRSDGAAPAAAAAAQASVLRAQPGAVQMGACPAGPLRRRPAPADPAADRRRRGQVEQAMKDSGLL